MAGCGGRIPGRTGVNAAVLSAQFLEDEQTVELARLRLHVQVAGYGPAVSHPADLDRQIAIRDGTGDLRPAAILDLSRKAERFDNWRSFLKKIENS